MESYPIMLDGEAAGRLTVERQGSLTVFEADCDMREGLIRLSVYGGGREGYLGVLAPEDGRLTLRKRLSRSQTREFPERIERVGRAGEPGLVQERIVEEQDRIVAEQEIRMEDNCDSESEIPTEVGGVVEEVEARAEPDGDFTQTVEPPELHWFAAPDGALVCFDGTRSLAALPLGDERIPEGAQGEPRVIEGREYLVFRERG